MLSVKHYFVCANSSAGFWNFFPEALEPMERVYILKGGPGTGKSTLMKRLGTYLWEKGEDVDYIHCSSDPASLDGVLFRRQKLAVVDGTAPHIIEPTAPGAKEEYLNLGTLWDSKKLIPHRGEILRYQDWISNCYTGVYRFLAEAKEIHDKWERVYRENTDYQRLNQLTQEFLDQVFSEAPENPEKGQVSHRFFGALTKDGSVHFLESLLAGVKTRCFIKGRPGTGKSTLMKKLLAKAEEQGLSAEVYHCSLDPASLDMVILPELSFGVFDATEPHELFPDRETDWILDLYEGAVRPGTDEENYELLSLFRREYQEKINCARAFLREAKAYHDDLEEIYGKAMDFSGMDGIYRDVLENWRPCFVASARQDNHIHKV